MGIKRYIVGAVLATAVMTSTAAPVFADGNGYAPGGSKSSGGTSAGFLTVLAAKTVDSSGAVMNATSTGSQVMVTIPAGAFSAPEQITVTGGDQNTVSSSVPKGESLVAAFGVNFSGETPGKPITLTISNPSIPAGAQVYKVAQNGLVPVHATVTNGKAIITFSNDPNFIVVTPKSGVVPQGTSPVTGVPLANGLISGAVLLLIGASLVVVARRKKSM